MFEKSIPIDKTNNILITTNSQSETLFWGLRDFKVFYCTEPTCAGECMENMVIFY